MINHVLRFVASLWVGLAVTALMTSRAHPAPAGEGDVPADEKVELKVLDQIDFRDSPTKQYLAKAGSTIGLKGSGAPAGRLDISWSSAPAGVQETPQPTHRDQGAGLVISLAFDDRNSIPIDIGIVGPDARMRDTVVTVSQGTYQKNNFVSRHESRIPADRLGGAWSVRWNHGLIAVDVHGETVLEVYLPKEALPCGLTTLTMKVSGRDIGFTSAELRGTQPSALVGNAQDAFAASHSTAPEVRRLVRAGAMQAAYERARDRVKGLESASVGHRVPLDVAAAHLESADAAILADRLAEVASHDEKALRLLRAVCGEDHPAYLEALGAIRLQVESIVERSVPSKLAAREALNDLEKRLKGLPEKASWLTMELQWALYRLDRPAWLDPVRATRLTECSAAIASARTLYRNGLFRDLVGLTDSAVASARSIGAGAEPELADALTLSGLALAAAGEVNRSLGAFQDALALRQRTFGSNHPATLTARSNVGYALFLSGRYGPAAKTAREVYDARSRSLGRHAAATWQALTNHIRAESLALGRRVRHGEFQRDENELSGLIERGASDTDFLSPDYDWVPQMRSSLPILKMYVPVMAPMITSWKWPNAIASSLLDDPIAFQVGRARLARQGIAMLRMPDGKTESTGNLSYLYFRSLLGDGSAWTTLAWWSEQRPGPPTDVERLLDQALGRFNRDFGADHPLTAAVMNNVAASIQSANARPDAPFPPTMAKERAALSRAEELARSALEVSRRRLGERHPRVASMHELLGITLYHEGRTAEADREIERCLEARREVLGERHPATSDAVNTLGIVLYRAGRYPEARARIERALQDRRESLGKLTGAALQSLNDLGVILRAQGDLVAARRCFERVLKEDTERWSEVAATARANLAVTMIEFGDFDEAKRLLGSDAEVRRGKGDITMPLNLGAIALAQGDDASAEAQFQAVLEVSPENVVALNGLGVVARKRGNFDEAERLFERALKLALGTGGLGVDRPTPPGVHLLASPQDAVVSRVSLGLLQVRRGNTDAALGHMNEAVVIFKRLYGDRHPRVADTLRRLGVVQLLAGRHGEARASLEEALRIKVKMAEDFVPVLSESESLAFLATLTERDPLLAALRDEKGTAPAAYDAVWATRAIVSRTLAKRLDEGDRDPNASRLLDRLGAVRSQLSALTLHSEQIRIKPEEAAGALLALDEEKEQIERDLAAVCEPYRKQLEQSRWNYTDLARRLPNGVAVVDLVRYADWSNREATLKHGQPPLRYVAFVLSRDESAGTHVLSRIELGDAEPIDRDVKAWRGRIEAGGGGPGRGFHYKRGDGDSEADSDAAPHRLRDRVWAPLESAIGAASTVVIIPDGSLTRVPWAALPGKTPDRYLIEDYTLLTTGSGQQLLGDLVRQEAAGAQAVVVGGVSYDDQARAEGMDTAIAQARGAAQTGISWGFLPGTRLEVDQIARLARPGINVVALERGDASEPAIRQALPRSQFVHLATHGFFTEPGYRSVLSQPPALDPIEIPWSFRDGTGQKVEPSALLTVSGRNPLLLTGVVLAGANRPPRLSDTGLPEGADGILTGEEIASLDLRHTRLVVLSACETGLGEVGGGEGVFGLQRAFHLAGAPATIASLWKVDDDATQVLMVEFYRNLWEKRLGASEALRQAQLAMISRYDPARRALVPVAGPAQASQSRRPQRLAPKLWAAFTLSGALRSGSQ